MYRYIFVSGIYVKHFDVLRQFSRHTFKYSVVSLECALLDVYLPLLLSFKRNYVVVYVEKIGRFRCNQF